MAKDLIRFSNDKKGFRALLLCEILLTVWAVAAAVSALRRGESRLILYAVIVLLAMCYITQRSLRSYLAMKRREKEEEQGK